MMDEPGRAPEGPVKYALIAAGSVCVAVGAIGIVVPLLPTTPFLLLAAACYVRSSPRFYRWLIGNRVLGAYVRDYLSGAGIPVRTKVFTIAMLWIVIGSSVIFAVDHTAIRALLLLIAVAVSAHIIAVPTARH
ncbi:MAG: YbaN family protein [Armatimonadota bacterium]